MITAKKLIQKLPIVDENALRELAYNPQLYVLAARYRVSKMRLRAEAVARYDYLVARLALRLRNKRTPRGKKPFTEGAIKERVQVNHSTRLLQRKQNRSYETEELAKQILKAFDMRREALRTIADAQRSEVVREGVEFTKVEQRAKLHKEARRLARRQMALDDDE